ncbi:aspartyl protease family protein [Flavobacterium sp. SUN046]|uniref:aspartyl protease family protein n=1 Tax=Flavobacterium sp. SUN046 TaxID=3002440 RepID=UPI002DC033A5|nr:aspartyl protease family protein [Flavobacterium sp. SUN046]MEC4051050.1 aspartyl protease family protein [Flavobacterium sp. SUN046]
MSFKTICTALFFYSSVLLAQQGFEFEAGKAKVIIPFKFINNLIIIPVQVNGVTMNFLLDTGVEDTVVFSLDDTEELQFANIEKIQIQGLGSALPLDGLKATNNILRIKNYIDKNHTIYIILDQDFNVSSQVGIPVNGILGYHFFQNDVVKINYQSKKITVYNHSNFSKKTNNRFTKLTLDIQKNKPYINALVAVADNDTFNAKLLIDTGNTDALWLFSEKSKNIKIPIENYDDFLGRGFSGEIYGKRARINKIQIANFILEKPIVAFPDLVATKNITIVEDRMGSIGSEIIKRFTVYFDYKNNACYFRKNSNFGESFSSNMTGLEIQHQGLQWVEESYEENPALANNLFDNNGEKIINNLKYKFNLKPLYVVANVRKNSNADLAGFLKGDIVLKINNHNSYSYTLQQIIELLKSDEEKIIEFEIERDSKILQLQLQLKKIL